MCIRDREAFDPAALVSEACRVLVEHPDFLHREQQRLELVVIDDLQEATPSIHRLLEVLCRGRDVVSAASPDTVVQGFRGARPDLLRGLDDRLGTPQRPLTRRVLGTGHRVPPAIQLAWQCAAQRIPALETALGARRPRPVPPGGDPEAEELPQAVLLLSLIHI